MSATHVTEGRTYVDTLSVSQAPWYDTTGISTSGTPEDGLLEGTSYLNGLKNIAISDSPGSNFLINHPSPNLGNILQTGIWDWDFELVVAVGTTEVSTEDRSLPPNGPGPRYPFFRRAKLAWSYSGTVNLQNGQYVLSNTAVTHQGNSLAQVQAGELVFDTDVRRFSSNGEPIIFNDAFFNGEDSSGPWPSNRYQ